MVWLGRLLLLWADEDNVVRRFNGDCDGVGILERMKDLLRVESRASSRI
jgi:hypothetical protein